MDIKIHSVHFDADQQLKQFVQDKLSKLERFDENIIGMEVFLRDENSGENDGKTIEAKVFVPGKDLFAKKHSDTFEAATDELLEALQRQVKKHKEKLQEKHR
jgi:putative sigma-54 modulation protein